MARLVALTILLGACSDLEPRIETVITPVPTADTRGPYIIEAFAVAPRGVDSMTVRVSDQADSERFADLPMTLVDGDREQGKWLAELPGRPVGTTYAYFVVLIDACNEEVKDGSCPEDAPPRACCVDGATVVRYPKGAPDSGVLSFQIVAGF